jgi:hypothetical protein
VRYSSDALWGTALLLAGGAWAYAAARQWRHYQRTGAPRFREGTLLNLGAGGLACAAYAAACGGFGLVLLVGWAFAL